MPRGTVIALAALVSLLAAPTAAHAVQRFAVPGGSVTGSCTEAQPCDISRAINNAAANDEVIVKSGDYGSATSPLTTQLASIQPNVDVHGEDGQPHPRIFFSSSNNNIAALGLSGSGARVRHLAINVMPPTMDGMKQSALTLDGAEATDIIARNTGAEGRGCIVLGNAVLKNSLCYASAANGRGVATYEGVGPGLPNSSVLRNVTAIAQGSGSNGIQAFGGNNPSDDQTITVTNSIARGAPGLADVAADRAPGGAGEAIVNIDHSNFGFEGALPAGTGDRVVDGPGNQRFMAVAFAGADDFHQAPGAITIDAGADDSLNGPTDFDGEARTLGGRTDIGADEFVPPPAAATSDPGTTAGDPAAGGSAGGNAATDRSAPGFVGALALGSRSFAAAGRGGSVQPAGRRRRAPVGTTVGFRLNEAAGVRFTVERALPGRRSGRRCVKPTRRNRRARKCTRYVLQRGDFAVAGVLGQNRFRFTGRLRNKKLAVGSYRLGAVATDPAGNASTPKRTAFRIVRR
jgi:hypothetical protein